MDVNDEGRVLVSEKKKPQVDSQLFQIKDRTIWTKKASNKVLDVYHADYVGIYVSHGGGNQEFDLASPNGT